MFDQFDLAEASWATRQMVEALPVAILAVLLLLGIVALRSLAMRSIDDTGRRYRVRKAIAYGGALVMAILLLGTVSSRVAQLSVAIGAIGAATVFALQEVIASIAGWIALSFGGFYKPGDRVELGGIKGDVIDIGLLRTTLMETGAWVGGDQYSGRIVRVANSFVFKEPVFNYSAEFPFLWDEIVLPLRYGSDIEQAKQLALNAAERQVGDFTAGSKGSWHGVARRYLIEQARLDPSVTVVAGPNGVDLTLRYIVDYRQRRSTRDAITCAVLSSIAGTDGAVRLASTTLEVVGIPEIRIAGTKPDES